MVLSCSCGKVTLFASYQWTRFVEKEVKERVLWSYGIDLFCSDCDPENKYETESTVENSASETEDI